MVEQDDFAAVLSPAQDVADGEVLTATVTRTAPGLDLSEVQWAWCADGAPLDPMVQGKSVGTSLLVTPPYSHYCAASGLSSSAPPTTEPIAAPANSDRDYPTVSGDVVAQVGTGTTASNAPLSCLPTSPCDLGLSVEVPDLAVGGSTFFNFAIPVTYTTSTFTGCQGKTAQPISTAGPERMSLWTVVNWQRALCQQDGGIDLVSGNAETSDEAQAISLFAGGEADLAYSAVGYGVPGFTPSTQRPYIAVPVALNAAVLALGNGYTETASNFSESTNGFDVGWSSSQPPNFTLAELEYLLAACDPVDLPNNPAKVGNEGSGLVAALQTADPGWGGLVAGSNIALEPTAKGGVFGVYTETGNLATTYLVTSFLNGLLPTGLNTGPYLTQPAGNCANVPSAASDAPLSVVSNFATASPPYDTAGLSGYSNLSKALTPESVSTINGAGPAWLLTDAATAAQLWGGLVDASLQTPGSLASSNPSYVGATPQAMDAAVADMIPQADGTFLANPEAAAASSGPLAGVQPYPLTFVEYALVPTQPFLNTDCTDNTAKEQALTKWLNYITTSGQAELSPGLRPLTPALQADALADIAKVGSAPVTSGPCAPPAAPTGLTVTATGPTTAQLSWVAPSSSGGSAITDYRVMETPFGSTTTTLDTGSTQTTYAVSGLKAAVYSFQVEALNQQGWSPPSNTVALLLSLATTTTSTTLATAVTTTTAPAVTTTTVSPLTLPPLITGKVFGPVVSGIVASGSAVTLNASAGGANATAQVPAGALPDGTTIYLVPITDTTAFDAYVPASQACVTGFAVLWQAPDGTSPVASWPVTLQVTDPAIDAGDAVYEMTGVKPAAIGTVTSSGAVTIPFEVDPIFFVAGPRSAPPTKPRVFGGPTTSSSSTTSITVGPPPSTPTSTSAPNSTAPPPTSTPSTTPATLGPPPSTPTSTSLPKTTALPSIMAITTTTTTTQAPIGPATVTASPPPPATSPLPPTSPSTTNLPATTAVAPAASTTLPSARIAVVLPGFGGTARLGWMAPASSALVLVLSLAGMAFLSGRQPQRSRRRA